MSIDPILAELAKAYGVATEYTDQVGDRKIVGETTIRKVLIAMGVEASSDSDCKNSLRELKRQQWRSVLPPSLVFRRSGGSNSAEADPWETWVHVPRDSAVRLWVELEDGARRFDVARTNRPPRSESFDGHTFDEYTFRIPRDLPLGWHTLVAEDKRGTASCMLIVTPERLELSQLESSRQMWGVATQLYSVRSRRSWGIGDLTDLSELAGWFGREHRADFMLVNPLHASAPTAGQEPSPYLPVTRSFVNPIYVRIESIPEYAYLPAEELAKIAAISQSEIGALNEASILNRDASWALKRQALQAVFEVTREPGRESAYERFRKSIGEDLDRFALWCALCDEYGPEWNEWPPEFHHPGSPEVSEFADANADRIEFFRWLQWIVDEQMAAAQDAAREAGMSIGVMHDLAVGVHKYGADTWTDPSRMARGVTVGAPPDAFNQVGQNWSQPPMRPDRAAATGYVAYRDMLRALLRHSGGLRIDHVLGLFRLWWIPEDAPPSEGTYVRYDHHAMVNILVLEAQRAGAVIVGEDLGTVEPWVRSFLAERGILGTTILWFERDKGEPIAPQKWRADVMSAVTVHDLPPTLGYLAGTHVQLRNDLGLLTRDVSEEWAEHAAEIASWRVLLEKEGLVRPGGSDEEFLIGLHRLVTWTPSKLLAVSLVDMVGDRRTQNQPGTKDEYSNWRVPLSDADGKFVFIEDLPKSALLRSVVSAVGGSTTGSSD